MLLFISFSQAQVEHSPEYVTQTQNIHQIILPTNNARCCQTRTAHDGGPDENERTGR